jgi:hypothetical protein
MCYIFDYSMLSDDEAERLISKIKGVADTYSDNGQTKTFRFCLSSGDPEIFNVPDCCGLRKVRADDPY